MNSRARFLLRQFIKQALSADRHIDGSDLGFAVPRCWSEVDLNRRDPPFRFGMLLDSLERSRIGPEGAGNSPASISAAFSMAGHLALA
jgi:hypothetical protein